MMNLTVFSRYICAMTEEKFDEQSTGHKITDVPFRKLYRTVVRHFDDRDKNLKRWMLGKPCRFISPITGTEIEVEIGKDIEALYYEIVKAACEFVRLYHDAYSRQRLVHRLAKTDPMEIIRRIYADMKTPNEKKYPRQIFEIYNRNSLDSLLPRKF